MVDVSDTPVTQPTELTAAPAPVEKKAWHKPEVIVLPVDATAGVGWNGPDNVDGSQS
jgi:hypothetical protein